MRQILDLLPQLTEDSACEALIQTGEDVNAAMELLLNRLHEPEPRKEIVHTEQQAVSLGEHLIEPRYYT